MIAAYRSLRKPIRFAWSEGRRPLGAILHSSNELQGESYRPITGSAVTTAPSTLPSILALLLLLLLLITHLILLVNSSTKSPKLLRSRASDLTTAQPIHVKMCRPEGSS